MPTWNPWHGCRKLSPGCQNCYVYRIDARHGRDSRQIAKTNDYALPLRRRRDGRYHVAAGETLYTCLTSDFFLEEADAWRIDAWNMIRERGDVHFYIITKRIDRFFVNLPFDWGDGYDNVTVCCTAENQDRADYRLPLFLDAPIRHREIICEPLLEAIDLSAYLSPSVEAVIAGGESGDEARVCNFDWVLSLRRQCAANGVHFSFKQTGARFIKDGRLYRIPRRLQHRQARAAGLNF